MLRLSFGVGAPCLAIAGFAACASSPSPDAGHARTPAAHVVNATILVNGCQDLGRTNAKLAEAAMYQLVEGCSSVPGGSARFEATLQPGGRISIAGAPGQPDVVPICILKHSLLHKVQLARPCRLDIKIEEARVPMASARDAGAG
jgi:hypothetical protein